jgi:exodeoxyribonuclease V alpha subunit
MVGELPHFGFATVDRLALRMGMKHDAPQRIEKGILYLMEQVLSEGTCYLEKESLIERAERLLHCDNGEASVDALIEKGDLIWVHHWVCCPSIYNCEKEIAQLLKQRLQGRQRIRWDKQRLATVLERERLKLATSQLEAVSVALGAPFSVITGGPGVGKTTIVKTLVKVWEAMGLDPQLAAPTGRAAQRLEEASGRKAQTLHRLLKVQPGKGFVHNAQFPLESRNFVVDETSMVDLELFKAFLVALPKGAQVVLVGDADQLPSVGPGRVLADLIKSGALPVSTLKTVFRQAGNSRLVSNSHRLLEGKLPLLPENQGQQLEDFYFVESSNADHTLRSMRKLITERLPLHFDAATMEQLQILSPMRKGPLGTLNLNQILQSWLNPEGRRVHEDQHGELRVGDKVVQMVNNYDVDLYNGDLGEVTGGSQQHLEVRFSGRDVHYEGDGIQDLSLAYAMTIHKAQGSEYPLVIVPISDAHRIMLNIPLLYTALTRAKTMCVFVGSWEVLKTTLERSDHKERVSLLGEFLKTATPDNNP